MGKEAYENNCEHSGVNGKFGIFESLNFAISSYEQLLAGGKELEDAREELIKGARQLNNGWDKFYEAKADGQKELDDAKKSLTKVTRNLKTRKKTFAGLMASSS